MTKCVSAACGCSMGKIRANNEDNLLFFGKTLPANNSGFHKPITDAQGLDKPLCFAVFDGMGGEDYGEIAAFTAAQTLKTCLAEAADFLVPEKRLLTDACEKMNEAVCAKAQSLGTERMGTTALIAYFTSKDVYVCNLGDSRAFRLRGGEFLQLSQDHTEREILLERGITDQKPRLMQYLGIDPQELALEPYVAKGELNLGDQYLLCSDGLTDMLTNLEIACILRQAESPEDAVKELIKAALANGGRDNITVVVCKVIE